MIPELQAIEPQLKQILYGCVEHVKATKAALYLPASYDLSEKKFELVTSYQYTIADRKVVGANDDVVDRLAMKRGPYFINGLGTDQRFAEILFRQGNDRLLAAPLFSRGRLIGFIDMRDKAGKKPFDTEDLEAAVRISEQMLNVLSSNKLFGIAPISLVEDPSAPRSAPAVNPTVAVPSLPQVRPPAMHQGPGLSAEAMQAIETAKQHIARRQLTVHTSKRPLSEADLDVVRLLLPAALSIPGVVMAAFSATGMMNNPHTVVAVGTVEEPALQAFQSHLQETLKAANKTHVVAKPQILYPFGAQSIPVTAAAITSIVSATIASQSAEGLILTAAFERTHESEALRLLQVFLRELDPSLEAALSASSGKSSQQVVAEKLLEPDFSRFTQLAEHCREVAVVAQRFARSLELPAAQVETVRLAALVHDVGLRLLDYERLHSRANLTAEEMKALSEHPVVGAAIVEPLLGPEVAQAVLRHHERIDGKGYPSRLVGQQIPLASRIIQIADAWIAMTSQSSYQPPVSRDQAVTRMREGAGAQFDPALVERFLRALSDIAP